MSNRRPGLFARLHSLVRGFFSVWIRDREHESPQVVYEQAISERVRQYRELKNAVAGVLYMRTKLEGEIIERRAEIARMHDDVRRAVRSGRDEPALTLIQHKQTLFEELERAEQELEVVRGQAEEAKENLLRFREEIRSLVREKGHMLATLANAKARRRLQVAGRAGRRFRQTSHRCVRAPIPTVSCRGKTTTAQVTRLYRLKAQSDPPSPF